jgi:hypothetical protein
MLSQAKTAGAFDALRQYGLMPDARHAGGLVDMALRMGVDPALWEAGFAEANAKHPELANVKMKAPPNFMEHVPHGLLPGIGGAISAPEGESRLLHGVGTGLATQASGSLWKHLAPKLTAAMTKHTGATGLPAMLPAMLGELVTSQLALGGSRTIASKIDHKMKERSNA